MTASRAGRSEADIEIRLLRRQLLAARTENQRLTGLLVNATNVHVPPLPELAGDDAAALVDAVCPPTRRRRNGEP